MTQYQIEGGSANRDSEQVGTLRAKVGNGEITAKEAAEGPIINPNSLNHAHTRKPQHKHGVQLDLL